MGTNIERYSKIINKEGYLTPSDAAEILNLSIITVRRLIRDGELKAVNVSLGAKRPTYMIQEEDLESFAGTLIKE